MKLLVLTVLSVTVAAASDVETPDGVTDESGNRYGIYNTNYRSSYRPLVEHEYPERRHPVVDYASEKRHPVVDYASEKRHPVVEYASERRHPVVEYISEKRHPVEYVPERLKLEEVVLNYGNYAREGYNTGYHGYEGLTRYPNYEYRRNGREGLGFDRRTAYALGLRYPVTPKILESDYRPTYHDSRNVLLL